MHIQIVGL